MTFTILTDTTIRTLLHSLTPTTAYTLALTLSHALSQYTLSEEAAYQPHRTSIVRPDGQVSLFMPATTPTSIGVKIVGVAPSTPAPAPAAAGEEEETPQPGLRSVLTICDERGQAVGVLNAAELTAFRTALGSMLLLLHRKQVADVIVFGAGKQAEWHVRLAILLQPDKVKKITFINRSSARARELVARLKAESVGGGDVEMSVFEGAEDGLKGLVQGADVVFCTTPSTKPLFSGEWVMGEGRGKGRYVAAIGSYRLDMQEIDPRILEKIVDPSGPFSGEFHREWVVVDSIKGCMDEAGELVAAGLKPEQMVEVGRMGELREEKGVQEWLGEGFVVYKSVGVGIMDIAIGRALMELAREKGVGMHLEDF
ncbi:ornithine cyclodeaminase mu-crystallin [Pyrenophora tritici-repentis]|uniref:Ornithine cyclodeaminase n=2 Tax=Pyrenophora tritici-repentis TaxID=45151 RepID=A0A2W1GRU2_9PLEO|nr:PrnX protein [Pyrenophora tritici-repentis Pt-1C-BFP]KAF7442944.1 Ornithine cyclodeaminase [Pyrenophora tritici-repentis]EDU43969.1 PrnX protein [Pyrenophora tritici-repentis Pt-1C-BFP]KAG9376455.1 Ornithine cyclodeaminase [Pyrenophora tritici-repentis]KAI0591209.1 Ornithine cyclodeaminase [Pyrenophora tritici-repentis]KAI0626303.1 Ornithine cyclodeaminase [Pyrenophora tritici-repentis]